MGLNIKILFINFLTVYCIMNFIVDMLNFR